MEQVIENRTSFFSRLEPYHAPSTLLDIHLAYTLAKFSHRAQVRKEIDDEGNAVRYFEHVRRVTLVLIDEARIVDPTMIIASLLHDGIEDTRDLTPAMIEHCFGSDVVKIVKILSKVPKEGYLDRFYTSGDWRPFMIKACDRLDNLRSLSQASPEFQDKQLKETQEKYVPLFDHLVDITPSTYHDRSIAIRRMITTELYTQLQSRNNGSF